MADIKFHCPVCNQKIGVVKSEAGREFNCPICHSSLIIPTRDNETVKLVSKQSIIAPQGKSNTEIVPGNPGVRVRAVAAGQPTAVPRAVRAVPQVSTSTPVVPVSVAVQGVPNIGGRQPIAAAAPLSTLSPSVARPPGMPPVSTASPLILELNQLRTDFQNAQEELAITQEQLAEALEKGDRIAEELVQALGSGLRARSPLAEGADPSADLSADQVDSSSEITMLACENEQLRSELAAKVEANAALLALQSTGGKAVEDLRWQVAQGKMEIGELKALLKSKTDLGAAWKKERLQLESRIQEQESEAYTLKAEIQGAATEIDKLRTELESTQNTLDTERRKLKEVGVRFAESEGERVQLQQQLENSQSALKPGAGSAGSAGGGVTEIMEVRKQLSDALSNLAVIRGERDRLRRSMAGSGENNVTPFPASVEANGGSAQA